jgi:hypothetical protein
MSMHNLVATSATITSGTIGSLTSTTGSIGSLSSTTAQITTGSVGSLTSTTANITTGTIGSLTSTTGSIGSLTSTTTTITSGTITTLSSNSATILALNPSVITLPSEVVEFDAPIKFGTDASIYTDTAGHIVLDAPVVTNQNSVSCGALSCYAPFSIGRGTDTSAFFAGSFGSPFTLIADGTYGVSFTPLNPLTSIQIVVLQAIIANPATTRSAFIWDRKTGIIIAGPIIITTTGSPGTYWVGSVPLKLTEGIEYMVGVRLLIGDTPGNAGGNSSDYTTTPRAWYTETALPAIPDTHPPFMMTPWDGAMGINIIGHHVSPVMTVTDFDITATDTTFTAFNSTFWQQPVVTCYLASASQTFTHDVAAQTVNWTQVDVRGPWAISGTDTMVFDAPPAGLEYTFMIVLQTCHTNYPLMEITDHGGAISGFIPIAQTVLADAASQSQTVFYRTTTDLAIAVQVHCYNVNALLIHNPSLTQWTTLQIYRVS